LHAIVAGKQTLGSEAMLKQTYMLTVCWSFKLVTSLAKLFSLVVFF